MTGQWTADCSTF